MSPVKKHYRFAVIAVDVVILTLHEGKLQALLMRMHKEPYQGHWAAPGRLIKPDESVEEAAKRHLLENTGLKNAYLEQLYTFGKVERDPFGRVVSVAYFSLLPGERKQAGFQSNGNLQWFSVDDLPPLAYDHQEMVETAIERLRAKLTYTNIVCNLLPDYFTLRELQDAYESILQRKLDKRNFQKKLKALGLIRRAGAQKRGEAHRPAEFYRFASKRPHMVEIV